MASKTKPSKSATDAANLNLKTQEGRDALDALVAQIGKDVDDARAVLSRSAT